MNFKNIELKAKCDNIKIIKDILRSKGAKYIGIDHQIDTYFKVRYGRLKLREGKIENYLIYYDREEHIGPKRSDVILFKTSKDSSLNILLKKALEIICIVEKKRQIYFIGNVKFHLDEINNLGSFVEIEAIDFDGSFREEELTKQCKRYIDMFGISEEDFVPASYADLFAK